MITKPEWIAASAQLQQIAYNSELEARSRLAGTASLDAAITTTRQVSLLYHKSFEELVKDSLVRGGLATADHYNAQLGLNLEEDELNAIVNYHVRAQYEVPYYGGTLPQRFHWGRYQHQMRILRSSRVGIKHETRLDNLARVFVHSYPFGSAVAHDKRILLSQMVKIEHDIARDLAARAEVQYVKWTLSHTHKKKDICDQYAEAIDPTIGQPGVYHLEHCPEPPHPNCQCNLVFIHKGGQTGTTGSRTKEKLKDLWGWITGRRR